MVVNGPWVIVRPEYINDPGEKICRVEFACMAIQNLPAGRNDDRVRNRARRLGSSAFISASESADLKM